MKELNRILMSDPLVSAIIVPPFDAVPHETDNAIFFDAKNITAQAIQNRKILAYALESVGFVNYYTEWWHWSYGDRYWAVMNNLDRALYNPVSEQDLLNL